MSFVSVRQLTKTYTEQPAVENLSFDLQPHSCIALLGVNGAGKTTTLKMLSGLVKPTSGTIQFHQSSAHGKGDIRADIGYLPQFPVFCDWMTGFEFLLYVGQLAHLPRREAKRKTKELLDKVGLTEAAHQRIGQYSGGMKQRLGIAQALIHQPKLVMLDEPVSALDPVGRREMLQLMQTLKEEATVLFSTHVLHDAEEVSDEVLIIDQGQLKYGGTLDSLQQEWQDAAIIIKAQDDLTNQLKNWQEQKRIVDFVIEEDGYRVLVEDIELAVPFLLHAFAQHQVRLTKFEVAKMSLEDLFLKVVQK
ncbi:ATP-binding cassette domain-containing protein [Shouchella clausii]|jgi:ABC-2 type transport system ATP-binding protein|uniref:ABC transporter ATP-binding protein n=1 Tax=Shouchella clausii TaxID=79880 RepID=UPI000BA5CAA8|nr:ABC transporter ATP-binding protein [Shouchella clausii]PAD93251.1 ABC transporter ATP-binding protein [Shouchella clausii]